METVEVATTGWGEKKHLRHTKLLACVLGVLCLTLAAFAGKFTGELGLAVSGMVCAFIGGNSFITGKALSNGKGE